MVRFNESLCRLCDAPVVGLIKKVCDPCLEACMELAPKYWEGTVKDKALPKRTGDHLRVDRPYENLKKQLKAKEQINE